MAGNELATAYVTLIPSLKGAQRTIESELEREGLQKIGEKEGDKLGGGMASKAGSKLSVGLAKYAGLAAKAAAGAIGAGFTLALKNYADYEQLSGGVQKVFDQMYNSQIFEDADNAYKTLNLSANAYLETINDVGANFASTMGDEAGYQTAKRGLQAISDFASGTGKSIDNLKDKFTLITRSTSSYQSIADQFSGVLPATADAFLENAQAAGLLGKEYKKLTEVPIDEYQQAVAAMLEKGVADLGLAGNTAAETASTISGSLAAAGSAWTNWLTGLASDDADIEKLTNDLVDTIIIAAENIIPRVGVIASSLLNVLGDKAGDMMVKGVEWMSSMAQGIADGASFVWSEIMRGIDEGLARIGGSIGSFIQAGKDLVAGIAKGIMDAAGEVWDAITRICSQSLDSIKSFFGIASPSKVMREMFGYVGEGMALGLEDKASRVTGAMSGIASGTLNAAYAGAPAMAAAGGTVNIYIDGSMVNGDDRIRGAVSSFFDELERMGLM